MPRGGSPERGRESTDAPDSARKAGLVTIGSELPDVESEKDFQANWKITKTEEVSLSCLGVGWICIMSVGHGSQDLDVKDWERTCTHDPLEKFLAVKC